MAEESNELWISTIDQASGIVAAYVANNSVPVSELPSLIWSVHGAIARLASGNTPADITSEVRKPTPTEIRNSVRTDSIVSFIEGNSYKTLKRHLTATFLDPRAYRERYGLPADYPMVASSYAERRSALAKAIGLGQLGSARDES